MQEADLILFLVDAKSGPHPLDERLAEILRKAEPAVLLVVNKADNLPDDTSWLDFWSLGMGEPIPVAAASGKGSGDLLDRVLASAARCRRGPGGSERDQGRRGRPPERR